MVYNIILNKNNYKSKNSHNSFKKNNLLNLILNPKTYNPKILNNLNKLPNLLKDVKLISNLPTV